MAKLTIRDVAKLGFSSNAGYRSFLDRGNMPKLVADAALQTTPNTQVPVEFLIYLDPQVIEILTAPRNAREIFGEQRYGTRATPSAKFGAKEFTGSSQPYTDFGQSRTSGVNYYWLDRDNYLFQTVIEYGDLEQEVTGEAKLNLAADKQQAAAEVLDLDSNRFAFFGVRGKRTYGILNEPNLLPAISPLLTGAGNSPLWSTKTTVAIYNDVLELFKELQSNSKGRITATSKLTLVVSPEVNVYLARATDFNVSVLDMLNKYFSNLTIVVAPEMHDDVAGETVMMVADNFAGSASNANVLGFSEKFYGGRIVPDLSSFSQKFMAGTYGFILRQAFSIATMKGM